MPHRTSRHNYTADLAPDEVSGVYRLHISALAAFLCLPTVLDFDKNGEHDELRFPTFHSAMLSQSWWNAGETLGRIRLVLSEGLVRANRHPPFERIKNIVAFSFQHVPLGDHSVKPGLSFYSKS